MGSAGKPARAIILSKRVTSGKPLERANPDTPSLCARGGVGAGDLRGAGEKPCFAGGRRAHQLALYSGTRPRNLATWDLSSLPCRVWRGGGFHGAKSGFGMPGLKAAANKGSLRSPAHPISPASCGCGFVSLVIFSLRCIATNRVEAVRDPIDCGASRTGHVRPESLPQLVPPSLVRISAWGRPGYLAASLAASASRDASGTLPSLSSTCLLKCFLVNFLMSSSASAA